jgi:hypothetical protein
MQSLLVAEEEGRRAIEAAVAAAQSATWERLADRTVDRALAVAVAAEVAGRHPGASHCSVVWAEAGTGVLVDRSSASTKG